MWYVVAVTSAFDSKSNSKREEPGFVIVDCTGKITVILNSYCVVGVPVARDVSHLKVEKLYNSS